MEEIEGMKKIDLKSMLKEYNDNKYKCANTYIIEFIVTLEKALLRKKPSIGDALLELNGKTVKTNTSPLVLNSFISTVTNMLKYGEHYDIKESFILDNFNAKHDTLNMYNFVEENLPTVEHTFNIQVPKDFSLINYEYTKDLLLEVLGEENYIKLLVVLITLYK